MDKGKCKGCGRPATTCWVLPCLVLEQALANGEKAVNKWCRVSKAPFTCVAGSK